MGSSGNVFVRCHLVDDQETEAEQYDIANNYIVAITLCDRVIFIAHKAATSFRFVETDCFSPVLFTAQQMRKFDVKIQAVFGFVMLVRMLRPESRNIVVGISPLLFFY